MKLIYNSEVFAALQHFISNYKIDNLRFRLCIADLVESSYDFVADAFEEYMARMHKDNKHGFTWKNGM
jgi:hypothetical protein